MDVLAQDAKGPGYWLPCFQAHDDVVPARIRRLGDVRTAGVGLSVGMAVGASDDLKPLCFGRQLGPQMLFRVNRVHHGAVGDIRAGNETNNFGIRWIAHEQAAHLFGIAGNAVRGHCLTRLGGNRNRLLV